MSAEVIQLAMCRWPRIHSGAGLNDQDCFTIAAALRLLPGRWLAQRDEGADGLVMMGLFTHETDAAPAFLVHRGPDGYRLEQGSAATPLGCFRSVRDLMFAARQALEN